MKKIIPYIVGAVLLIAIGGTAGWYFAQQPAEQDQQNAPQSAADDAAVQQKGPGSKESSDPIVAWSSLVPRDEKILFSSNVYFEEKHYKVGNFTSGKYKDGELILVTAIPDGMAFHNDHFRFARVGNMYTLLEKYSDGVFAGEDPSKPFLPSYELDKTFDIPSLNFPSILSGPKPGQTLQLEEDRWEMFDPAKFEPVFYDKNWGTVYTDKPGETNGPSPKYGFYLRAPDGTIRTYSYQPSFIGKDNIPFVTWNDGTKNNEEYVFTDRGGCGSFGYASIKYESLPSIQFGAKDEVVPNFSVSDLAVAGKAADSSDVYTFKDSNHYLLKKIYNDQYAVFLMEGEEKITYEQFTTMHPIFFWKDPFDRWMKFENAQFQPMAECGKPVIYLYPEKTTDVLVQLNPKGGFSKSEPAYGKGWEVVASPNGTLVEKTSGKTYPYLFWEGRGGIYKSPSKGFVVAQKQVHNFLVKSLAKLGLNAKETADFIEFWEPRMQGSPYYFVSFYGTKVMDELAPLTITPRPETVIRILMDFSPLDAPIEVKPIKLDSLPRKGFTVIEWGGVLK